MYRVSVVAQFEDYEHAKACFENLENVMQEDESILTISINREDDSNE